MQGVTGSKCAGVVRLRVAALRWAVLHERFFTAAPPPPALSNSRLPPFGASGSGSCFVLKAAKPGPGSNELPASTKPAGACQDCALLAAQDGRLN